jgi:CubicO group peptidase (beta-lactamase class C family)
VIRYGSVAIIDQWSLRVRYRAAKRYGPAMTVSPRAAALALALALVAAGCSSSQDTGSSGAPATSTPGTTLPPVEYPDAAWPTADAAAKGLDPGPLATLPTDLEGSETDCVVVVKDGKVVYEHTWNGFDPDTDRVVWSVSKSLTSLLIGIAANEGKLRIDQPASDIITEWKGTPSEAVTIKQLLSMVSGRFFTFQNDFVVLPTQTDDQTAFSIGLSQEHPPGTKWVYSNSAVQVLDAVLSRATGQSTVDYSRDRLFAPLGIEATWLLDKAGHPWTYGGASMSCRDLARVGYLMLNDGKWKDRQVVPAAWVHDSIKPSQDLRTDYGLLWWLNTPQKPAPGAPDVQSNERAPVADNAYFARGLYGQYIAVIPDDDTIVIRTGRDPADTSKFADDDDVLNHVLQRVTEAEKANPA